ncbi:MAG: substrate-binding domain-containing protein, partial [Cutibacterium granulosum]|nr:substrate-binding domain-containing protein [Cutibacterium granulosum]
AQALTREAAPWLPAGQVPVILHFAIDAVEAMAQAIHRLSDEVDVLGLVALDHPLIRHAVARAAARGVRVFTLLSDLSVPQRSGHIGLDNQKAGRTAAWFIERLCRGNGEIGIIIGDNRFTCQESCEISFRSCLREQGMGQQILEQGRVSDARGPPAGRGHGARRCAGLDAWRRSSPRPCRDREARRRGAGELCPLGLSPATTRNEQVDQWRAMSAAVPTKGLWRGRVGDF